MPNEYQFKLPFSDIDFTLIDCSPSDIGSPRFADKVSTFFGEQFQKLGGIARVVVNDTDQLIEVRWTKGSRWKSPKEEVLSMLKGGRLAEAIPLIWTLHLESPDDTDHLYNLGVTYSELGDYAKAVAILERLVEVDGEHVHGRIALGVAQIRSNNLLFGEEHLRKALKIDPDNQWALRNLGACLMKQERFEEAVPLLEHNLKVAPADLQAMIGLGQALEELGRTAEADDLYVRAIDQGGPPQLIDLAKESRTKLAHQTLRGRSSFRPDVAMYISGALDRFTGMSLKEIQDLGFEIAILGQSGLDINDPSKQYSIRSLPGTFSGLHLVSIMYAAFQQFAPGEDVGIDFSAEYESAISMRGGKS